MTGFDFADVVLVPFPFTDQSATKRRPAVIVSSGAYHRIRRDLIILAITSQVRPATAVGEVTMVHWKEAGLLKPSVLKPVLATIERRLVLRKLGHLESEDRHALQGIFQQILGR